MDPVLGAIATTNFRASFRWGGIARTMPRRTLRNCLSHRGIGARQRRLLRTLRWSRIPWPPALRLRAGLPSHSVCPRRRGAVDGSAPRPCRSARPTRTARATGWRRLYPSPAAGTLSLQSLCRGVHLVCAMRSLPCSACRVGHGVCSPGVLCHLPLLPARMIPSPHGSRCGACKLRRCGCLRVASCPASYLPSVSAGAAIPLGACRLCQRSPWLLHLLLRLLTHLRLRLRLRRSHLAERIGLRPLHLHLLLHPGRRQSPFVPSAASYRCGHPTTSRTQADAH